MENMLNLQMLLEVTGDYASECINTLREYKKMIEEIIDEYGFDKDGE